MQLHGPDWYVRGQATGPEAAQYWDAILKQHGPQGMLKLNSRLRTLLKKHPMAIAESLGPEQMALYGRLRAEGRHPGRTLPALEEK